MSDAADPTNEPQITLTDDAIREVRAEMADRSLDSEAPCLRVVAREKNCGCGSVAYGLGFEPAPRAADVVSTHDGLQVVIGPDSRQHVSDVVLDYASRPGRSGFVVEDSTADGGCGCGGHHH